MDPIDRKILALLQTDASLAIADIAQKVGLSQTPCWKRIQKMEAAGGIKGRVALLNNKTLNLGLTVFVQLSTKQHDEVWLNKFSAAVNELPDLPTRIQVGLLNILEESDVQIRAAVHP